MATTVAFIGLGKMGLGMADSLRRAGFSLRLYNRTASRYATLVEQGATGCASPAEAAEGADFVVSMLADDASLLATALGEDGFVRGVRPGVVHIAMSTISTEASRALTEEHRARGLNYVAAPVLGRPDVAAAGNLWIVAAGAHRLEARCRPLFEAMGRGHTWLGDEPAQANAAKIAMNFVLVSTIEMISEAFTVVEKAGGDRARFFELMRLAFTTPASERYAQSMLDEAFEPAGFASSLALKDAGLMLRLAEEARAPAPLASLVHDQLLKAVARGRGDWDLAALIQVSRESAGLA